MTDGFSPVYPYYTIHFLYGELDLSVYLSNLTITNNINNVYQRFIVTFNMSEAILTKEEVYGQKECTLEIFHTSEDKEMNLMNTYYLTVKNISLSLEKKDEFNLQSEPPLSQEIVFECIPSIPYKVMTTLVNFTISEFKHYRPIELAAYALVRNIWGLEHKWNDKKTILEKLKENQDKFTPKTLVGNTFITENYSDVDVSQCLIPPMPFLSALDYIDEQYSIYKGLLYFSCIEDYIGKTWEDEERGVYFNMWDLSWGVEQKPHYKIYFFPQGNELQSQVLKETGNDDTAFYVFDPVTFRYNGNEKIMERGYKNIVIAKPEDTLYNRYDVNTTDVWRNNTINHCEKDVDLQINKNTFKNRINISNKYTGYKYNEEEKSLLNAGFKLNIGAAFFGISGGPTCESYVRSRIARKITALSSLSVVFHRNLKFRSLSRVGIPIEIVPLSDAYLGYEGKYIVSDSTLEFTRKESYVYTASASIKCIRSNIWSKDFNFTLYPN
jgi:hypothetical protein